MKVNFFAVLVAGLCLGAMAVTVDITAVQQRYPWNGLVDVDYVVAYGDREVVLTPATGCLEMTVTDGATSTKIPARSFKGERLPLSAGRHRVTWDAAADGCTAVSSALKVSLSLVRYPEKYLVVDISNGARSTSHSVSYLDAPPDGGFNTDEYKTKKIAFRLIPAGTFVMGSPITEWGRAVGAVERQHVVTITKPFYMALFEMTRAQYTALTGKNPGDNRGVGSTRPLSNCALTSFRGTGSTPGTSSVLGVLSRKTGLTFELPSEAQWEWACRAGTDTPYNNGVPVSDSDSFEAAALATGRSSQNSASPAAHAGWHTVVGSYAPNAWGLYDMHGNVREILRDRYVDEMPSTPVVDPVGGNSGTNFCWRGGSHAVTAVNCRSAARAKWGEGIGSTQGGYRVIALVPGN